MAAEIPLPNHAIIGRSSFSCCIILFVDMKCSRSHNPTMHTYTHTVPEGLSELSVTFVSGRVLITWTTPTSPNGIISEYRVERTTPSVANISLVGTLTVEPFVVADINVRPFTMYMYRLVVENGGGVAVGAFTSVTTPQTGECV